MQKAEFGSVRFFRRVITFATIFVIAALIVSLIIVANGSAKAKDKARELQANVSALEQEIEQLKDEQALTMPENPEYAALYPSLYVDRPSEYTYVYDDDRFFYLTFDGGPSEATEAILDKLDELGVKATFFVSGTDERNEATLKRIADGGHTIGVYFADAPSVKLYDSVESYLDDFAKEFTYISDVTGECPKVFRFKGGTVNKYNANIEKELTAEMLRRGFVYYDWNAVGGDDIAGADASRIAETAIGTAQEKQRVFLLLHDDEANKATADALPEIVDYYRTAGYTFEAITNSVRPVSFD